MSSGRFPTFRALWVVAAALSLSATVRPAQADGCAPASGVSTCFDTNNVWVHAGPTRFVSIAPAEPIEHRTLALAVLSSYLDRPVQLRAPSPDPDGRDIPVVRGVVDLSLAYAYGLTPDLELSLATPIVLHQTGSGAEGITSQSAPPLGSAAVRDPRVGAGFTLPFGHDNAGPRSFAKLRLELGVPLGDDHRYAGAGNFTLAPSFSMSTEQGPIHFAGELAARLRPSVPFATARIGSALLTAVGVGVDVFREYLSIEAEAFMLPSLVSQPGQTSSASRTHDGVLVPAEWLLSLRSVPTQDPAFSLSLGGGTGLPLSSETRETPDQAATERFAGVTTPRFRLFFGARYTPASAKE